MKWLWSALTLWAAVNLTINIGNAQRFAWWPTYHPPYTTPAYAGSGFEGSDPRYKEVARILNAPRPAEFHEAYWDNWGSYNTYGVYVLLFVALTIAFGIYAARAFKVDGRK